MLFSALPDAQGLYDPDNESDSCGVAMVTDIQGRRSHSIVADGLTALEHLEHRGAGKARKDCRIRGRHSDNRHDVMQRGFTARSG
mgnify:CR=1 FL=1